MMAIPLDPSAAAGVAVTNGSVSPRVNVAALLTCHNRREKTVACLERLLAQDCLGRQRWAASELVVNVFLVDDGSCDGTTEMIRERFPQVSITHGPGDLFWAGGMRLAWRTAVQAGNHDAYLLLNDDTLLRPNALRSLLETLAFTRERHGRGGIAVGSVLDEAGRHHYGGTLWWRRRGSVIPGETPKPCDLFNCNATLVSSEAHATLGGFSDVFTHSMADYEYAARAHRRGVPAYVATEYVGVCHRNPVPEWLAADTPLRRRWKILQSPKGLPPWEYRHLCQALYSWWWPIPFAGTYLRLMFPWLRPLDHTRHVEPSPEGPMAE